MEAHRVLKPGLILLGLLVAPAVGLPADRVVQYAIRVDPTDPNSRVQYVLSASLSARQQDGNWIGWEVESYTITEKAVLGSDTVWEVALPYVDTSDGLWWVEHADPDNPTRAEFVEPAGIGGTAVAGDSAVPNLKFWVVGVPYAPPPDGAPYEVTGAINFAFSATATASDPPADSGNGEPVDLPDVPQDPGMVAQ